MTPGSNTMTNERKGVRHNDPEMRSTGNSTKDYQENSAITDATQVRPAEVFDSAKYNAMSDMAQGASLDTREVEALSNPRQTEVIESKDISKGSITDHNSKEGNFNIGSQTPKITPMTIEERA